MDGLGNTLAIQTRRIPRLRLASSLPAFDPGSRSEFARHYNRISFLFAHELHDSELFSWPNLLELAHRHPETPEFAYWSNGEVGVDDGWDAGNGPRYSLRNTVLGIGVNNSLAMLKHTELDPVFGPHIRAIQQRVLDLVGLKMRHDVIRARGTFLIASPWRITSYHIDADVNFLFQIGGDKLFRVFDPCDRAVTPHEELENYFLGNPNGAVYEPAAESHAKSYDLRAGCGVHVPCMAAHWAQNLGSPSIALSINFDLRSVTTTGRIYRLNGRLRRLGFSPTPPGSSRWRDKLKSATLNLIPIR
jgi:hypothetical protein